MFLDIGIVERKSNAPSSWENNQVKKWCSILFGPILNLRNVTMVYSL